MRRLWLIFSQAATVAVALLFVVNTLKPQWLLRPGLPEPVVLRGAAPAAAAVEAISSATAGSLRLAARRAGPSVVSVNASRGKRRGPGSDPTMQFFRGGAQPEVGVGSGVIVSAQGYVLTNYHVIEGASDIEVKLADGREARAEVVGSDPDTDLAVLKINLDRLPAIVVGPVEALAVGDPVLAIGNPFNVGQTATAGIVSGLGRQQLGLSTFENFIQTDAAINPGNSGGALVDSQGQLIGINTAIYSRSGGNMGIGFAIPADLALQVMHSLVRDGRVTRGWIGVEPRDLTPEFAENFKLPVREGVLITGVLAGGPASAGGLKPGDVVLAVAGKPVSNTTMLLNAVAALTPGSEAALSIQRGAQALELKVVVALRPSAPVRRE